MIINPQILILILGHCHFKLSQVIWFFLIIVLNLLFFELILHLLNLNHFKFYSFNFMFAISIIQAILKFFLIRHLVFNWLVSIISLILLFQNLIYYTKFLILFHFFMLQLALLQWLLTKLFFLMIIFHLFVHQSLSLFFL